MILPLVVDGQDSLGGSRVMRRPVSLGFVIWIVIGLLVAANKGFLGRLDSLSGVLSAMLAVLAWPLVVLNVHVAI